MKSATQADALVSSLFPSDVKHMLYRESSKSKMNKNDDAPMEFMGVANPSAMAEANPIASLYPETSVLFAGKFVFCSKLKTHLIGSSHVIRVLALCRSGWLHFMVFEKTT